MKNYIVISKRQQSRKEADMANPLFEALNGNRMAGMLEQFQQFRKEMEGRNPNEEINRLLQSGKINQQQLNQAQQMAQQMQGMFKGFFK
jgi:hypothetical protein